MPDKSGSPVPHRTLKRAVVVVGPEEVAQGALGGWMGKMADGKAVLVDAEGPPDFQPKGRSPHSSRVFGEAQPGEGPTKPHGGKAPGPTDNVAGPKDLGQDPLGKVGPTSPKSPKRARAHRKAVPGEPDSTVRRPKACGTGPAARSKGLRKNKGNGNPGSAKATGCHGEMHKPGAIEALLDSWNQLFPHIGLSLEITGHSVRLEPLAMGNLEGCEGDLLRRLTLALSAPLGSTLIVASPAKYLDWDAALMLWMAVEDLRPDCFFIYITNDIRFAASHDDALLVWAGYNNPLNTWNYVVLEPTYLPDLVLLGILQRGKPVIFTECRPDGFGFRLYEAIYGNYSVIPCENAAKTIQLTKGIKECGQLDHLGLYGIICRGFLSDKELKALKAHSIYAANIGLAENLYLTQGILDLLGDYTPNAKPRFAKIKKSIIDDAFIDKFPQLLNQTIETELRGQIEKIPMDLQSEDEIKAAVSEMITDVYSRILIEFTIAKNNRDYDRILLLLNKTNLLKLFWDKLNLDGSSLPNAVLTMIAFSKRYEVITALKSVLPEEIDLD
ncbi:MAG: hypothetical protein LBF40_02235 [Deltaproteobacteria bacterium]|nr:hypothetical protein [Deltaproteobacteria bacterium]